MWVQDPMGWIDCVCCEKFRCDFMARTFALIAPLQPVLQRVYCHKKHSQTHPRIMKWNAPKHEFRGPTGWIGCSRSEKLRSDFVAWTFALIAPIHHVLHWVYFHNKAIPNAPKHYETHQNMSLWSYGVDRVRSFFQKFWSDFVAWTFALIAPVEPILHRVSCSNEMIPNPPRHYETHQNMSLR